MKKLKLFLSLATMSLCIAVLCMGVLAYTSANYKISGNITYNVADVYVKITTQVFKVQAQKSVSEMESAITKLAETTLGDDSDLTVDGITYTWSQTLDGYNSLDAEDGESLTITDSKTVDLAMSKSWHTYFIIVNIENLSTRTDVCAYGVDSTTGDNIYKATNKYQNNIQKGEKNRNIVMAYSLIDTQKDVDTTVSYSINVNFNQYVENIQISTNLYSTDTTASSYTKASELRTTAKTIETSGITLTGTEISSASGEIKLSDTATTLTTESQKINYSTAKTYWIVSEIKNNNSETAYVKITDLAEYDFLTSGSFIYRSGDILSLEAGETSRVVAGLVQWTGSQTLTSTTFGYSLEIGKKENYSPIKKQEGFTKNKLTTNAYYYVEMGDFYGLPIRWRMIAEEGGTTGNAGVYALSGTNYTHVDSCSITSGTTNRIFIQETNTAAYYSERTDNEWLTNCSFNNYDCSGSGLQDYYKCDENGEMTEYKANDYYNSKIRQYLTLTGSNTINKYSDGASNNLDGHTSNYLTDLNIVSGGLGYSNIYEKIVNRTSMGMATGTFSSNVWTTSGTDSDCNYTDYGSGKTTSDKFWLLSVEEMLTWMAGGTTSTEWETSIYSLVIWRYYTSKSNSGSWVWLRSGSTEWAEYSYNIYDFGDCQSDEVSTYDTAVRAAFQLSCKA